MPGARVDVQLEGAGARAQVHPVCGKVGAAARQPRPPRQREVLAARLLRRALLSAPFLPRALLRDLPALGARFGEADRDGLLAALHLGARARAQRALLAPMHGAL